MVRVAELLFTAMAARSPTFAKGGGRVLAAGLWSVVASTAEAAGGGIPTRLFHDSGGGRRTWWAPACGRVAMEISGHRTRAIFVATTSVSGRISDGDERTSDYVAHSPPIALHAAATVAASR